MTKKTKITLIALFFGILLVKVFLVQINYGPQILPDEACVIETAKYFSQNFSLTDCHTLTKMPHGNPPPFIPIVFSIFYWLFGAATAYKLSLFLHSLLATSLLYPLYQLGKNFIKNTGHLIAIIIGIIFMPQILAYETTVMSETMFAVTNIWTVYFYHQYSNTNKNKYKIASFFLAFLALFMRPFGIITIASLLIMELLQKGKIYKKLLILLGASTITIGTLVVSRPDVIERIFQIINYLTGSATNLYFAISALTNQVNSLITASLGVPLAILIMLIINRKKIKQFPQTLTLVGILITLNLLIASIPLFTYYTEGMAVGFSTRYINLAIILTFTFGIFGLYEIKKINKKQFGTIGVLMALSLINFVSDGYNPQTIYEYVHIFVYQNTFFSQIVTPLIIATVAIVYFTNKSKIIIIALIVINIFHSASAQIAGFTEKRNIIAYDQIYNDFKETNERFLFLVEFMQPVPMTFWSMKLLTENTVDILLYKTTAENTLEFIQIEKENLVITMDTSKYDYVVTGINLDIPLYKRYSEGLIYKMQ